MQGPDNPQDAAVGHFEGCSMQAPCSNYRPRPLTSYKALGLKVQRYHNIRRIAEIQKEPAHHKINVIVYLRTHHAPAAVTDSSATRTAL